MKNILYTTLGFLLLLPVSVMAAPSTGVFASGGSAYLNDAFANLATAAQKLIPFFIGIAFLAFIIGLIRFVIVGAHDEEKRAQGKGLMIWSVIAFVVIVSLFGLVNLLANVFGVDNAANSDTIVDSYKNVNITGG